MCSCHQDLYLSRRTKSGTTAPQIFLHVNRKSLGGRAWKFEMKYEVTEKPVPDFVRVTPAAVGEDRVPPVLYPMQFKRRPPSPGNNLESYKQCQQQLEKTIKLEAFFTEHLRTDDPKLQRKLQDIMERHKSCSKCDKEDFDHLLNEVGALLFDMAMDTMKGCNYESSEVNKTTDSSDKQAQYILHMMHCYKNCNNCN